MEVFEDYLNSIENVFNREKLKQMLNWVVKTFPQLKPIIAWNQPMFTNNGTFIIAFSASANHFSFAPELFTLNAFRTEIENAGYTTSKKIGRVKYQDAINHNLFEKIINHTIKDKDGYTKFWR